LIPADLPGYAKNNPLYSGPWLVSGWLPVTIQIVAGIVMFAGIGRRSVGWLTVWLPSAAVVGAAAGWGVYWYVTSQGLADNPPPLMLWVWTGLAAAALVVAIGGWARSSWGRRATTVLAIPLCLLAAAVVLNQWIDYYDTVKLAWAALTAGPLPDETDMANVQALKGKGVTKTGRVVPIDVSSDISGFHHRTEYVYLPPAWFATPSPHALPVVVMISGAWSTPADWVRLGNVAVKMDSFAAAHGGAAPILLFPDTGGRFNNDTECVNGPRGNVADHITKELAPYVVSQFGASSHPDNWGVVGWSMGGTCAVDLTVTHPELFHTFVDIAGDLTPNAGTKEQTVQRLYGGNEQQWTMFDTLTSMHTHDPYHNVAGWFDVSSTAKIRPGQSQLTGPLAAKQLCAVGTSVGITCTVVTRTGNHDWAYAQIAFAQAFPWIAGQVGTPGIPRTSLPVHSPPANASPPRN
jgi:S-formylglutathione hydrolase FrmB